MILIDTSGLVAALLTDEPRHEECFGALQAADPPLILSPFVVAEADYLLAKFGGLHAELELLDEIGNGSYEMVWFEAQELLLARELMYAYADLKIGLTDASVVVLAERLDCFDILTLDERHFRALRVPGSRRPFRILPADR